MMRKVIVNEAIEMIRFQKRMMLLILRTAIHTFRYGLWFLPWIIFFALVARPIIAGWRTVRAEERPQSSAAVPDYMPQTFPATAKQKPLWDQFQSRLESSLRTLERVSRKIKKR